MNYLSIGIGYLAGICQILSLVFAGYGIYYLTKQSRITDQERTKIINSLSVSTGAFLFAWILLNVSGIISSVATRLDGNGGIAMKYYKLTVDVCNCKTEYRGRFDGKEIRLPDLSFTIEECVFPAGTNIFLVPFLHGSQFAIDGHHGTNILMVDIPSPHRIFYTELKMKSFDRELKPNEILQAIEKLISALRDGSSNPRIPFSQWLSNLPKNPAPKIFLTHTT